MNWVSTYSMFYTWCSKPSPKHLALRPSLPVLTMPLALLFWFSDHVPPNPMLNSTLLCLLSHPNYFFLPTKLKLMDVKDYVLDLFCIPPTQCLAQWRSGNIGWVLCKWALTLASLHSCRESSWNLRKWISLILLANIINNMPLNLKLVEKEEERKVLSWGWVCPPGSVVRFSK